LTNAASAEKLGVKELVVELLKKGLA
jgi:hypothetical protein